MSLINRCPWCNSIWVCWNWACWPLEQLITLNPQFTREELKQQQWGHECWQCGGVHETATKVQHGMPYWFLKLFYKTRGIRAEEPDNNPY